MLEIKLISIVNGLGDRTFYCLVDAVDFFREMWVRTPADYILIINGRRYEWPETPYTYNYITELGDHLRYCIDLHRSFYEIS